MKTCPKCNLSYPDEKKFCKNCGGALNVEPTLDPKDIAYKSVYEDKLKINPLDTTLLREYAQFLFNKLLFKDAITVLLKVLAIDENDSFAPGLLYQSYMKIDKLVDALEIGEKLLQAKPEDVFLLSDLADIAIEMGQNENALRYLENIIKIKPKDKEAWIRKADLLNKASNKEEAIAAWITVYNIDSIHPLAALYTGIITCNNKDFQTTIKIIEPIIEKIENPKEKNLAYLYFAYSLLKVNDFDAKTLPSALKQIDFKEFENNTNSDIKGILAEIFIYQGNRRILENNFDAAIDLFKTSQKYNDTETCRKNIAEAYFKNANLKFKNKLTTEAKENIEKAIVLFPENAEYKTFIEKLTKEGKKKKRKMIIIAVFSIFILGLIALLANNYINNKNERNKISEKKLQIL